MNADGLARELAALDVPCRVDAIDRLAVLVPLRQIDWGDEALRRAIATLLPQHGFTHVAVELHDPPATSAPLSGG
jgi:hypothetical protein